MNKHVKELWVAALRSGNYRQGQRAMRKESMFGGDVFCCLGVLCDVYRRETGQGRWGDQSMSKTFYFDGYANRNFLIPPVLEWAGLDRANPRVDHPSGITLADLNDSGVVFDLIADVIEKQF